MNRLPITAVVVSAAVATLFVLANIPGKPVVGPRLDGDGKYGLHFICGVESVMHGWPLTYLTHDGFFTPTEAGPSAWRVGKIQSFSLLAFVINGMLAAACVWFVGYRVVRRRSRFRWRFRLTQLLLATLCVGLVTGWITQCARLHREQVAFIEARTSMNLAAVEWHPFGSYWLRKIAGDAWFEWGDRLAAVDLEHSDLVADVPGKSSIRVLRVATVQCHGFPSLAGYSRLLAIDMSIVSYDYRDVASDDELDFSPVLRQVARCRSIEGLNLYEAGVSNRSLRELSELPRLKYLELSGNPDITDDGLRHLASLQSLTQIGLWGTGVTEAGVSRLQTDLPDCTIHWEGT